MKIKSIDIDKVVAGDRQRDIDAGVVVLLAENIAQNGLLQPIGVNHNRRTDQYELIYGAHRLAACKRLQYDKIDCLVLNVSKNAAAVMEADENFIRSSLKPLEFVNAYKARKEAYEVLHPETKHGHNRLNRIIAGENQDDGTVKCACVEANKNRECKVCSLSSKRAQAFINYAADHLGFSVRKIRMYLALDKAIFKDVKMAIKGHHSASSYGELRLLGEQSEKNQRFIAALLTDNPHRTISECVAEVNPAKAKSNNWEKDLAAVSSRFSKSAKRAQIEFLDELAGQKLPGGYRLVKESNE